MWLLCAKHASKYWHVATAFSLISSWEGHHEASDHLTTSMGSVRGVTKSWTRLSDWTELIGSVMKGKDSAVGAYSWGQAGKSFLSQVLFELGSDGWARNNCGKGCGREQAERRGQYMGWSSISEGSKKEHFMFKGQRKAREAVGTVSQGKKKETIPLNPAPLVADFLLKKQNLVTCASLDIQTLLTASQPRTFNWYLPCSMQSTQNCALNFPRPLLSLLLTTYRTSLVYKYN